ncbi:DoxX family membrane protein [candidate division KSB1 bacterium]|nr:DoxX family membrane protein [candidate division KSB1 bacterium]
MKIKSFFDNRTLFILFRCIIGFTFIYAGIEKIMNPGEFAVAIKNYRILPDVLVNLLAIILPWIELLAGLAIFTGLYHRGGNLIVLTLLIIFTMAISINLFRGVDISCGCKTPWQTTDSVSILKLLEEFILILLSLQILFHSTSTFCLENILLKSKRNQK